jgi:AcrR family transcriptional regulator
MQNSIPPKDRILTTAYNLFYTQGYNATGINQILEEANVAKASLYKHFGSKEDLGVEYIKKVREDWFKSFEKFISQKENAFEKILASFDFLEINMISNDFQGCRFLNLLSDINASSSRMQFQIVEHKTKLRNQFKELVEDYTVSNNLSLSMPNIDDAIYLLFEAAIIESKVYKNIWPIQTAKKTAHNFLTITY